VEKINESFAKVLDSLKGVIESIGDSSKKAGEGFSMLADAIIKLVNQTGFFDLAATLKAVADSVGSIAKTGKDAGDAYENLNKLMTVLGAMSEMQFGTMAADLETVANKLYVITLYTTTLDDVKKKLEELNKVKLSDLIDSCDKLKTGIDDMTKTGTNSFATLATTISEKLKNASKDVTAKLLEIETTFSNKLTSISTSVTNTFSTVVSTISDKLNSASTEVNSKLKEIESTVTAEMASISSAISTGVSGWKTTVESAIKAVKDLFGNGFSWEVPELKIPVKTPKFSVEGKWTFDDDGNVKGVPKIKVEWYRRAAELGALFTEPQIVGVGDAAQPELLIGEDTLFNKIRDAVAMGNGFNQTNNITVKDGETASETARMIRNQTRQLLNRMRGGV
jgi:ElaB/YqjD/DUF883 family membrane-anchored ribosome-binding protein